MMIKFQKLNLDFSHSLTDLDLTKLVSLFLPRGKATNFWYTVICTEYQMADKVREQ